MPSKKSMEGPHKRGVDREASNPVIKIVEIDKQIHLRKAVKEEIRMFGLSSIQPRYDNTQSQPRYDCQPFITNIGDWKRKEKGRSEGNSMRKTTYNEVFKLQILPKLIDGQKMAFNSNSLLKHHKSLK